MKRPSHLRFTAALLPVFLAYVVFLACVGLLGFWDAPRAAETQQVDYVGRDTAPLVAQIDSLRALGMYDEALTAARDLLGRLESNPQSRPFQVEDAQRRIRSLQSIVALPDTSRKKLAQADRLYLEGEGADARQDIGAGESAARECLEIRSEILGPENLDVASSMNSLAGLLRMRGNLADAEPLYRQSLDIRQKLLGDEHPDVAASLTAYALLLRARGDLAGAEAYSRQALTTMRKLLGPEHPDLATCIHNLANVLMTRGDFAGAEPLYREALMMRRKFFGEENLDVAVSLGGLATALRDRGDYAAAEPLTRKALAIRQKLLGDRHRRVAVGMNELALLLAYRGDYAGAEPLFQESLDIMQASGPSGDLAVSLNNVGVYKLTRKEYDAAERILRQSLDMTRQLGGPENPAVARCLGNIASILRERGSDAEAEPLCRESLAMQQKFLGRDHPDVASSMYNLAHVLTDRGSYASAESLHREALVIRQNLLGERHPYVVKSLVSLAELMEAKGDYVSAEGILQEAAGVFEDARLRSGTGMSRTTFLESSPYTSLAGVRLTLGETDAAWPAVERSLGRALSDLLLTAEARHLAPEEKAREDSLLKALRDGENRLAVLARAARQDSTGEGRRNAQEARTSLLETEARWTEYCQAIASKYPVTEGQSFNLQRVQGSLRSNQAIIGWFEFQQPVPGEATVSWAYVVRNQGPVRWARLEPGAVETKGLSDQMKAWVERLRNRPAGEHPDGSLSLASIYRLRISRRPRFAATDEDYASRLGRERLAPLLPHLTGVDELVVIPSGQMLGIPVEALEIDGDRAGDRFAVSYVPSATIYAWLLEKAPARTREGLPGAAPSQAQDCLALGDPQFQPQELAELTRSLPDEWANTGWKRPAGNESAGHISPGLLRSVEPDATGPAEQVEPEEDELLVRGILAGNRDALSRLPSLPSTRDEAVTVASLFGGGSRLLIGDDATEQELVRMASAGELARFGAIHLATHALVDDERPERSALVLSQTDLPDPYHAALGGQRIYDGMLDAREIVREWKLDADLVSLSACETALGRLVAGEGYVGLADAFLQAGARSLLVSLWRVEDQSTGMLMKRFYENWRGGRLGTRAPATGMEASPVAAMTKADALREAKHWLREWRDEDGNQPFAHPFYWAGFILIGGR